MKHKRPSITVRFDFGDGDDMRLTLVELALRLLNEQAHLSRSCEPHLQTIGKRKLAEAADIIARSTETKLRNAAGGKKTKLTPEQERRLVDEYEKRKRDGQTHGAMKALGAAFGVDPKTVRAVVRKKSYR